jgi:hypothetical protein
VSGGAEQKLSSHLASRMNLSVTSLNTFTRRTPKNSKPDFLDSSMLNDIDSGTLRDSYLAPSVHSRDSVISSIGNGMLHHLMLSPGYDSQGSSSRRGSAHSDSMN